MPSKLRTSAGKRDNPNRELNAYFFILQQKPRNPFSSSETTIFLRAKTSQVTP